MTDANHINTWHSTAEFLCGVLNCPTAGLSEVDKKSLCEQIRIENLNACKACGPAVECAECDDFGGDGFPCPPPQAHPELVEPEGDKVIRTHGGFLHLDVGRNEVLFDLQNSGEQLQDTYRFSSEINFQALSMALSGRHSVLVSGYDAATGAEMFVLLQYETSAPQFIDATIILSSVDVSRPSGLEHVPGTQTYEFVDAPSGRVLDMNIRNGQLSTIVDYTHYPDYADFDCLQVTRYKSGEGETQTAYWVSKYPFEMQIPPRSDFIEFVDFDGDGVVDLEL